MAEDEPPRAAPQDEVRTEGPGAIAVLLGAAVRPSDVPRICRRLRRLLERGNAYLVVCDTGALVVADLAAVDALAHLQLTARRYGSSFSVRGASSELRALLALTGLYDTVPLRPRGQTEQREQRRGVEEGVDPGDTAV